MQKKISDFESKNNLNFKNKTLLRQVFVHRSYLNENLGFDLDNNERLEFLGDAVLELVVTEYLYLKYENPEGELTNWRSALVKGTMLAEIANKIGINDLMYLSRGESKSIGKARQLILANAFEALIGAIYLDGGYKPAKKFIENNLIIYLDKILENRLYKDSKSLFQELSQEKAGITPQYKVISEIGPDHAKKFTVGVYLGEVMEGSGVGSSKQEAEQMAAQDALKKYDDN